MLQLHNRFSLMHALWIGCLVLAWNTAGYAQQAINESINSEADNASVLATVNSQVDVQSQQSLDKLQEVQSNSAVSGNESMMKAFEPAKAEFGSISMSSAQEQPEEAFGGAASVRTQALFEPAKNEFASGLDSNTSETSTSISDATLRVDHLSSIALLKTNQGGANGSNYVDRVAPRTMHWMDIGSYGMQSPLPGEFPDSTRERVWPSPAANFNEGFLRFTPKIGVLMPDFDNAMKPHFFYNQRTVSTIKMHHGSEYLRRSMNSSVQAGFTGLQSGLNTNREPSSSTLGIQPGSYSLSNGSPLTYPLSSLTGQ